MLMQLLFQIYTYPNDPERQTRSLDYDEGDNLDLPSMEHALNLTKSKLAGLFQSSISSYSHKLRIIKSDLFLGSRAGRKRPLSRIPRPGWHQRGD